MARLTKEQQALVRDWLFKDLNGIDVLDAVVRLYELRYGYSLKRACITVRRNVLSIHATRTQ